MCYSVVSKAALIGTDIKPMNAKKNHHRFTTELQQTNHRIITI
ncbi:MAG: hypothetical protein ACFBSE_25035 [Prochloraceae cyanobacterium]